MLTANDIGEGEIKYESARHTTQSAFDQLLTDKSRPQSKDILVTKDGTLGRVALADGRPTCINQSVALLRLTSTCTSPEFVMRLLRAPIYQEQMVLDAGGTTIKHIYITRLAKMPLAMPPLEQQEDLLVFLTEVESQHRAAVALAQREIDLLREYRTRLIADVVTGKLDVREAAARLPAEDEAADEVEEAEVLEKEDVLEEMEEVVAG